MKIGVISIFPKMFDSIIKFGITKRAIKKKKIDIKIWNPIHFCKGAFHSIDDRPYGGGSGMVMKANPIRKAILEAKKIIGRKTKVFFLSPQGKKVDQKEIEKFLKYKKVIFLCGRYRGIDERIIDTEVYKEISIGDYIISGGELAAMVVIDAIIRIVPGVLGNHFSILEDSFYKNLLDYPQYTRPKIFLGKKVPEVLLNGNHKKIKDWKLQESLKKTFFKRPDLLKNKILDKKERNILENLKKKNTEYYEKYNRKNRK
ncbi:tRNA (guanosine(37)-N1)-methyltransferase TrmD [bacterium endosymbiont of Pedicinus badii]|uniref:tRNA (guanosine(37)-N1)-methyltransferase TrmD n=1 Tax=bacterium endosymbiont of Pedicinus badii TaxID=1719126 RepID=UPI0009BA9211|nr:tRNA (guanine-N1)-methyltransferase [bacterium endosymbiont of Pedicinus badii]